VNLVDEIMPDKFKKVEDIKELVVSTLTIALPVASSHPQSLCKMLS